MNTPFPDDRFIVYDVRIAHAILDSGHQCVSTGGMWYKTDLPLPRNGIYRSASHQFFSLGTAVAMSRYDDTQLTIEHLEAYFSEAMQDADSDKKLEGMKRAVQEITEYALGEEGPVSVYLQKNIQVPQKWTDWRERKNT